MKSIVVIYITLTVVLFSCETKQATKKSFDTEFDTNSAFNNDSTWSTTEVKNDSLRIEVIYHNQENVSIYINLKGKSKLYDLNKLKISFKTPELVWFNSEYACFVTWCSGPFGLYLFVPFNNLDSPIYSNKDIKETDSIHKNFLYIDTIYENKYVEFVAENLKTRRTQKFQFEIQKNNTLYPYYDSIKMSRSSVQIWSGNKSWKFNIGSIKSYKN